MEKLNDYINAVMAFIDKIIEKINNISFLNFKPATKTVAIVFSVAIFLIAKEMINLEGRRVDIL